MQNLQSLDSGVDLLRVSMTASSVTQLYEQVSARIADSSPKPLVVVEDNSLTAQNVAERLRLDPPTSDVVLATSGSTGTRPNLVGLSWRALLHSAQETNRYLAPKRWLVPLPPHHIAGFQIVVRSALLGSAPLTAPTTAALKTLIPELPPGIVTSLVPTQLQDLLSEPLEKFDAILVGGAAVPLSLQEKANHFPLVTTYGMTETSGGCVYDGKPLPGTQLHTRDGRIHIGGPTLMDGYLDTQSPFTQIAGQRYLITNDAGTWDGNQLSVLGRVDQVIISGGENLNPTAIEECAGNSLPGLQICVVGIPEDRWGQVASAAVVSTREDLSQLAVAVRQAVTNRLGKKAAPRRFVAVEKIPLLSNGKVDLQSVRRQVLEAVRSEQAWSAD